MKRTKSDKILLIILLFASSVGIVALTNILSHANYQSAVKITEMHQVPRVDVVCVYGYQFAVSSAGIAQIFKHVHESNHPQPIPCME